MAFMKSTRHHLRSMIKKSRDISSHQYSRFPCSSNSTINPHDDINCPETSSSCPHHYHHHESSGARKGYVPVMIGNQSGVKEKFMVRIQHMAHPSIVALLELSADEFGYRQQGVLQIPCEPDLFREIISKLSNKKR